MIGISEVESSGFKATRSSTCGPCHSYYGHDALFVANIFLFLDFMSNRILAAQHKMKYDGI